MKGIEGAKRKLGSNGRFPVSAKLCEALPVSGLDSIAAVRIFMALLWLRDTAPQHSRRQVIQADLRDIRDASGYTDMQNYKMVLAGLESMSRLAFMRPDGDIIEAFDFVYVECSEEGKICNFRMSEDFERMQTHIKDDGYGMVSVDEVLGLGRSIDFSLYLRTCAVRHRNQKKFDLSRNEIFCMANKDPEEKIGDAVRSVKSALIRVCKVLKVKPNVRTVDSGNNGRLKSLQVSIKTSKEVKVDGSVGFIVAA